MVFASGASPTEMRTKFAIGCFALLVAGSVPHRAAAAATPLPQAKVEQAVINALPTWHGTRAQIIEYLDFTKSFATTAPWALVVARDAKPPPGDLAMMGNGSPIVICFVKTLTPRCGEARGHAAENGFDMTNGLIDGVVVFAGPGRTRPLLMLQTSYAHGLNGNANIGTKLFEYDRKTDGFRQVFVNITGGSNNNAAARFVEHGPLQGDVIELSDRRCALRLLGRSLRAGQIGSLRAHPALSQHYPLWRRQSARRCRFRDAGNHGTNGAVEAG